MNYYIFNTFNCNWAFILKTSVDGSEGLCLLARALMMAASSDSMQNINNTLGEITSEKLTDRHLADLQTLTSAFRDEQFRYHPLPNSQNDEKRVLFCAKVFLNIIIITHNNLLSVSYLNHPLNHLNKPEICFWIINVQ